MGPMRGAFHSGELPRGLVGIGCGVRAVVAGLRVRLRRRPIPRPPWSVRGASAGLLGKLHWHGQLGAQGRRYQDGPSQAETGDSSADDNSKSGSTVATLHE